MLVPVVAAISIHALREESDAGYLLLLGDDEEFQSTLSVRRATMFIDTGNGWTPVFQSTLSVRRATSRCSTSI